MNGILKKINFNMTLEFDIEFGDKIFHDIQFNRFCENIVPHKSMQYCNVEQAKYIVHEPNDDNIDTDNDVQIIDHEKMVNSSNNDSDRNSSCNYDI